MPLSGVGELPEVKTLPSEGSRYPKDSEDDERREPREMGGEIKKFGEEVANRIDRVIKRKGFEMWGDPWTVQGIPLIFPSGDTGFNLGVHGILSNIRRTDPHKMQITGQILASDRGRYKHFVIVDMPHLWSGKYRFTGKVAYNRDINFRYFGIGNETTIDRGALDNDAPLYKNTRVGPSLNLRFLAEIGDHFLTGPLLNLKWTNVEAPTGSLLTAQNPSGSAGGNTHSVGWAFVYDTQDFEPYPTSGHFLELYVNKYAKWTGADFDFLRTTFTWKHYYPLHSKLTFAHRTLIESLAGDAPFYELGAVGGSDNTIGFGGDRFMRGYQSNRFIDHIRTIIGFELRWDPILFNFANEDVILGFVPFIDIGKVSNTMENYFKGMVHASTGWGFRINWNKRFIVRYDLAVNQEEASMFLELGNSF